MVEMYVFDKDSKRSMSFVCAVVTSPGSHWMTVLSFLRLKGALLL